MSDNNNLNNNRKGNFVVYSSSAGSGKTYTLTRFFIKLLLDSNDSKYFRTVVAITFTNKAANEMKERIFQNLILLSEDVKTITEESQKNEILNLRSDYSNFIGISEQELIHKSEKIVSEILHNYSDLTVQTIDKFTHKIIRPFARDLDVSPDFNIELGEDEILAKSIDVLLQDTGKNELLTQILLDFAEFKIDEGKRYQDFEKDISELCNVFKKEDAIAHLKGYKEHSVEFFFDQKNKLKEDLKSTKSKLTLLGVKALDLMKKSNVSISDFYQARSGVGVLFLNISKGEFKPLNSYHKKALEEDVWCTKTSKGIDGIELIKSELQTFLLCYVELLPEYKTTQFLYQRIFPTALLNEIEKIIQEVKTSQNILTLSDFNKMISGLINSSHLSVPFLYERIGSRYNHYLIDEFQDTSILQWNNLLPLVDDSLAKGKENLIVGDGKQAIYRWRNGDVEQFVKLPEIPHKPNEDYEFIEQSLIREFSPDNLDTNYRSYSNVIEFNNSLYESLAKNINSYHQKIYHDVAQKSTQKIGGFISVELIDKKNFVNGDEKPSFKTISLDKTISYVNQAIDNGFSEQDIAILVRNNKDIKPIAKRLLEEGKSVVSDESLRLSASSEVQVLIAFLRFIDDNNNVKAALELIQLLFPNWNAERQQSILKGKSLFDFLKNEFQIQNSILTEPISNIIHQASSAFSLDETSAYYIQFKNFVWSRFKKDGVSLSDFVRHWGDLEEKERIPSLKTTDVANAIRIMSIHKSKGLQFPVVILPYVDWSTNLKSTIKWVEPKNVEGLDYLAANVSATSVKDTPFEPVVEAELEEIFLESLNMLYVATTRAEEQLYVCVDAGKKSSIGEFIGQAFGETQWSGKTEIVIGDQSRLSSPKIRMKGQEIDINSQPRTKAVELKIAPESTKIWGDSAHEELDYGNLFHYQVSRIKTLKDVAKIQKKFGEELSSEQELVSKLSEDINLMIKNIEIQNIFNDANVIYNEQEIHFNSDVLRIDKLAVLPNGDAVVLDFKTGEEKKQDHKQVVQYQEVLNELGFSKVMSYLYYTKSNKIIKV